MNATRTRPRKPKKNSSHTQTRALTTTEDFKLGQPVNRVIMFVDMVDSAKRRKERGWDTAADYVRQHNVIVTRAVNTVQAMDQARCEIVKYLGDGVMVLFDENHGDLALNCAQRILDDLCEWSKGRGADAIQSRVGMSLGEVLVIQYCSNSSELESGSEMRGSGLHLPLDWQGKPIDIAARLIADVALPGQIVVDAHVKDSVDGKSLNGAKLEPILGGEELPIDGEEHPVTVYELVLPNSERQPIENRRNLARELTGLVQPLAEIRLRLSELTNSLEKLLVHDETSAAGHIDKVIKDLEHGPFETLETRWKCASQCQKATRLDDGHSKLVNAFDAFSGGWNTNRGIGFRMQNGNERESANLALDQLRGTLTAAGDTFDRSVHNVMQAVFKQL